VSILPRDLARAKFCFAPPALARGPLRSLALLLLAGLPAACHTGTSADSAKPDSSAAASSAAQSPAGDASSMQHGTVRFETPRGEWIIDAELARSPEEHARGLMWRRDLAPDRGMLFLFDETREQRFWMHNTLLRLDMIFLGDDREVVGVVANAEPQTDTGREVGKPSRYVLEVAGGEAAVHAVGPGTRAQFIGISE
jgi:hypothetical protein